MHNNVGIVMVPFFSFHFVCVVVVPLVFSSSGGGAIILRAIFFCVCVRCHSAETEQSRAEQRSTAAALTAAVRKIEEFLINCFYPGHDGGNVRKYVC